MTKNKSLLKALLLLILLVITAIGLAVWLTNQSTARSDVTSQPETKRYFYQRQNVSPSFYIHYSSEYIEKFNEGSASWDITLSQSSQEVLLIDISGQGKNTLEESLNDWVTLWGSLDVQYEYTLLESGTHRGTQYKIFGVTEPSTEYTIGIYDVASFSVNNGRTHMAVKSLLSDIDQVRAVIESVEE